MKVIPITADVVSLMVLLNLLIAVLAFSRKKDISTKIFLWILISDMFGTLTDAWSYYLDTKEVNLGLKFTLIMFDYQANSLLLILFSFYLVSVIRRKTKVSYRIILPIIVLASLNILQVLVGTILGKAFLVMETGAIVAKDSVDLTAIFLSFLCLIIFMWILFRYRKSLEKVEFLALFSYTALPILGVLLYRFASYIDFNYVLTMLSCLINYALIQSHTISEADLREKILYEAFHMDALTGLKNRRAYDDMLRNTSEEGAVGVIFADLNCLKYANDTFGHEAGDKLLIFFADLLRETFPEGSIFRISGDEFVVILEKISAEQMETLIQRFKEVIHENDWIASFGSVYGPNHNLLEQVRKAEKLMYDDKAFYYISTGKDRRR